MRIVITFLGLIAHLSLSSSNTAVLPIVKGHNPVLLIIRGGCTIVPPVYLTGKHVRIYGAQTSLMRKLDNVPSLREVASCQTPLQTIDQLKNTAGVAAYVQIMDGGTLRSSSNHMRRVHFDSAPHSSLWNVPHCSSCRVEYQTHSREDEKTILLTVGDIEGDPTQATKYHIGSGDTVLIVNESDGGAADDFKAYESLFTSCDPRAIPKEDAPVPCGTAPVCINADTIPESCRVAFERDSKTAPFFKQLLVSPSVGCTNSQWP